MKAWGPAVVIIACAPLFAFAQATSTPPLPQALGAASETPQGLTPCSDYYTFGSTQIDFTGELSEVAAGSPIGFEGTITNDNPYPIVDADIYVKIFRVADASPGAVGPQVVDFYKALGPVTLQAGQSEPISFAWNVPRDAQTGEYEAATYVAVDDRFNLYGLTFSDDVVGSMYQFSVVGGQSGSVSFDNSSIEVGGQPFYEAAFPPAAAGQKPVPVTAMIDNTTGAPANVTLTWQLYYWDSILPDGQLDTQTQTLTLPPDSTSTVSYTVNDTSHSVYYLLGTLSSGKSKSLIEVRFTRPEVNSPRIAFVGVTGYPLSATSTLFMCAHDTNDGEASSSVMDISIIPTGAMSVLSWIIPPPHATYSGAIPGNIVALATPASGPYASFTVDAKLYQNGSLVDEVQIPYSCRALGASCGSPWDVVLWIVGAAVLVIALVLLFALAYRVHPRRDETH